MFNMIQLQSEMWKALYLLVQLILLVHPRLALGHLLSKDSEVRSVPIRPTVNVIEGKLNQTYNYVANSSVVSIFQYGVTSTEQKFVVHTSIDDNSSSADPVTFEVRDKWHSASWHLPIDTPYGKTYYFANKTVCLTHEENRTVPKNVVTLTVSTLNPVGIAYSVTVKSDARHLLLNASVRANVSETSPYILSFTNMAQVSESEAVTIFLRSNDTNCLTVSVQEPKCPFIDTEDKIHSRGNWETMTTRGAITLRKNDYKSGFFLVLVANIKEHACYKLISESQNNDENKYVEVFIRESIHYKDLYIYLLIPIVIFPILLLESFLFAFVFKLLDKNVWNPLSCLTGQLENTEDNIIAHGDDTNHEIYDGSASTIEQSDMEDEIFINPTTRSTSINNNITLNQTCQKPTDRLEKKYRLYFTVVLPVGIYYLLPVLQLVYIYIYTVDATGNLDMCYYNFECAYPVGPFKDFNHVISNFGYLLAGSVAMIWLWCYHKSYHSTTLNVPNAPDVPNAHHVPNAPNVPNVPSVPNDRYGIPVSMWYSYVMAVVMIFEGLLSACYHVCPNHANFHHDTCFMYVAVTLTGLKLYQSRHPDKCMTAPTAFVTLGCIMLIDLGGNVFQHISYIILVLVIHFTALIFVYLKMLYLGNTIPWSKGMFREIWTGATNENNKLAGLDVYCCILVSFLINIAIVGWHFHLFPLEAPSGSFNFETYLLFILGGNMIVYYVYYLVMKCFYKEKFNVFSVFHRLLSMGLWIPAIKYFFDARTSWQETPAESRTYNRPCAFYDSHDVWHMLSAAALYTNLLAIETMDHHLRTIKQSEINVF